jgi:hypothetical protein
MLNARDHYWHVAGDAANVYSSARNIYVPTTDTDFVAWTGRGFFPGDTESEAGIWHLMQDWMPLYLWDGTNFSQPAVNAWRKTQLQNYNSQVRFDKVTGGMTAAGVPVKTDDRSRGFITDARTHAKDNPNYTAKWFGSDGLFYPVDAPTIISMADQVTQHSTDCYTVFEQVSNEITTNAVTTLAQIDQAYSGL